MILLIYGSGGLGREVYDLACRINQKENRWEEISFIDDVRIEENLKGIKVYKFEQALSIKENCECVVALGEPNSREKLYNKLIENDFNLVTLIDPSAIVSPSAVIKEGCVISPWVRVSNNSVIQSNCLIQTYVNVGHDITIGQHSVFGTGTFPGGYSTYGNKVFIGMGVTLKDKLNIGDNVIIGMGSTVFNDIPSDVIVLGNPARVMRKNEDGKIFK